MPATRGLGHRPGRGPAPAVGSPVLGALIFVAAEAMFFAALVSAFLIGRASAPGWPPLGQPRAASATSALATAVLLLSAVALFGADRAARRPGPGIRAGRLLGTAIVLGAAFLGLQGTEWLRLVWDGLTMRSSVYGGFFYLVIGTHALHAAGALAAVGWMALRHRRGTATRDAYRATQIFWYFVVATWPVLYVLVYLL